VLTNPWVNLPLKKAIAGNEKKKDEFPARQLHPMSQFEVLSPKFSVQAAVRWRPD
jgi:hypothetical protein